MALGRRTFMGLGAAGAAGAVLSGATASAPKAAASAATATPTLRWPGGRRPNLLVLLTDQQRHVQHWPAGKLEELQPSLARLGAHGLRFDNAFTSAAQCTPARGVIMTGTYPWMNGVTTTFGGAPLQSFQLNLGRLLAEADYEVAYKGKWHLSSAAAGGPGVRLGLTGGENWNELDIWNMALRYGFTSWNPPDAGVSLSEVRTAGAGTPANDSRFVRGLTPGAVGQTPGWGESVLEFIDRAAAGPRPFCLFVSLVNPHDVGFYPNLFEQVGFRREEFADTGISLPSNLEDPLDTKPGVQKAFRELYNQVAPIDTEESALEQVNFYAWLHGVVEPEVAAVLDALDDHDLTESTVVFRFSDHGEQAQSHGMVEKMYQGYEETIHVPLVVSNPVLFPGPVATDAFWSHVDLLPTLAELAGVPAATVAGVRATGVSAVPVLADPSTSVRDDVLFTFDDSFGALTPGIVVDGVPAIAMPPDQPPHIRMVRQDGWKYAVYFTPDGSALQYEMYDLAGDPGELVNLAFEPGTDPDVDAERQRLHRRLTEMLMATGTLPLGFRWPATSGPAEAES